METIDCREPVARRFVIAGIVTVIAIADDRGAGIGRVRHTVMHPRQHRCHGQIGVGVGAAGAVLDMPGFGAPAGMRNETVRLFTPQVGATGA